MTPTDYFLWIYIKSKVYVNNYENISDLISAIISAFQEVSDEMVTSTERLNKIFPQDKRYK